MRRTPTADELDAAVAKANVVAGEARVARSQMRRRTEPGGRRQERIQREIKATKRAAVPIRRYLGMLQFHDLEAVRPGVEEELRTASRRLQYERGQLRKMLR